jgi:hypothetical protein
MKLVAFPLAGIGNIGQVGLVALSIYLDFTGG